MRASKLYHNVLKDAGSKITIKSIILEEQEHLAEMESELATTPHAKELFFLRL
nr:hypothetical protein [Chlamydia poikilotherma]